MIVDSECIFKFSQRLTIDAYNQNNIRRCYISQDNQHFLTIIFSFFLAIYTCPIHVINNFIFSAFHL